MIHASWNFTASGHRKSIAHGQGRCVKNNCDLAVSRGKDNCSKDNIISTMTAKEDNKIQMFVINETQKRETKHLILPDIKPIPKTHSIHQLIWTKENPETFYLNYLSCSDCLYLPPSTHFAMNPNSYTFD